MSKVFGYTKKGGKDWFSSDPYLDKEIESIKDPEGGSETTLPTAIPSPFARIDLVKNAFRNISKSPNLKFYEKDGNVVSSREDELLVSNCLDLAEMLFNFDTVRDKVRIITWDREGEIKKLKESSPAHRRLAETLELYLEQDKRSYNFDLLKRIFLIEYDHKIIGATSPVTLFFTTANDLGHAHIKLTTNHVLFDSKHVPLYERDGEFQRFFYLLFKSNSVLSERLREFGDYLDKNLKILNELNPTLYSEIKKLNPADFVSLYSELNTGTNNDPVEVIGVGLRKRKSEDIILYISSNSDFRIASIKWKGDRPPLVLQNDFSKSWLYAKDKWNKFKIPFVDRNSLEKRKLPEINVPYPYLTVSDFLEPYLIRLVYPINKDNFFDGNIIPEIGDDSKGFLLPLKPLFFDYFNSEDLLTQIPGRPKIEMVQGAANSVKVTLKVPVTKEGEYVSFERIYYQSSENEVSKPDEEKNKGVIVEHQFGITLFPFIKTNDQSIKPFYRVQLVDRNVTGFLKNVEYDLKFFSNVSNDEITINAKKIRSAKRPDAVETATSQYYVLDNNFDFIQVKNQIASGIIIPKWKLFQTGNEVFSFAIDFGTTNTHIEYKVGTGSPKPFDITPDDVQITTLYHPIKTSADFGGSGAVAIKDLIEHEFIPHHIGGNSFHKFPHRTIIAESHTLNIETETFTLADFNIPFIYGFIPERDKIHSNLKWAKREQGNQKRVTAFFEKLIMLMRNKVLSNRGNLSATRLVWFYPSSMKPARRSSLEGTWNELFEKYFNSNSKPIAITESLAPFYYFKGANRLPGGAFKPVVSVDIGGGTTDVVVIKSNKPLLLTSFKFAANTIFGDGFSEYGAANSNGLINKYFAHYENLLATNNLHDLSKVLSSIKDKNKTEDINAFFFSIESNPKVKDKKLYSYNNLLANDEDLKIVFVYFYSAIIYHVAELMKKKNIELPKHLIFSGTGSKILSIITSDLGILSNLSKRIFEWVYKQEFGPDGLSIETEKEMPKEVTCKGGLMSNPDDLAINVKEIKSILTCLEDKGIDSLSLDKLNDSLKTDIANYVSNFNSFFLKLNQQINFTDYFNVSPRSMEIFKSQIDKHVRDYLEEGLEFNRRLDDVSADDDKEIEETLFFYPLIGAINNLTGHLTSLNKVNN